jgi:hypothetical protein
MKANLCFACCVLVVLAVSAFIGSLEVVVR